MEDNKVRSGLLGFFIGLAIIIPGFSGAQIAIMFKLYDRLMEALGNLFNKKSIFFLIPIAIGGIVGFLLGLFSIRFLLEVSMFAVVALFAGLMLGGITSITKEIKGTIFKKRYLVGLVIGLIIPLSISFIAINTKLNLASLIYDTPWYMYLAFIGIGILVALTQLIPGLSATSLLMSFGLYDSLMQSISLDVWKNNPSVIIIYLMLVVGAIIGVISIAKVINYLLKKYKTGFYYLIIGLCLSSIVTMFYNPEIMEFYSEFSAAGWVHILVGSILFVTGAIIVYLTTKYLDKKEELV